MHCANPNCRRKAEDLLDGTLWLLETELPPDDRITGAAGGFPMPPELIIEPLQERIAPLTQSQRPVVQTTPVVGQ
jgi:hypothetical protein